MSPVLQQSKLRFSGRKRDSRHRLCKPHCRGVVRENINLINNHSYNRTKLVIDGKQAYADRRYADGTT